MPLYLLITIVSIKMTADMNTLATNKDSDLYLQNIRNKNDTKQENYYKSRFIGKRIN